MSLLRFIIFALFLALFAACDSGESSNITQPETIKQYIVQVYFENRIIPDSAIVSIYSKNHIINATVKTRMHCIVNTQCFFETAPVTFGEYAKITVFTHSISGNDTTNMEFSRFAPMNAENPWIDAEYETPILNIYTAAASKAVDKFLKDGQMTYEGATAKAYENMKNFGFTNDDFEKPKNALTPAPLPYLYCRFFLSDSVFYSDFLELQDAIRDGEWGDTLFRVRAADAMVRTLKKFQWENVPGMIFNGFDDYIANFWESTYGMEVCNDNNNSDTVVNANRRSAFYDSVFVCSKRMKDYRSKWQHWRLREPKEKELGVCNPKEIQPGIINIYNPKMGEIDSTIYVCGLDGWEKTNNVNTILKYRQVPCENKTLNRPYVYNDTLYLCHGMIYSDEEWEIAYLCGEKAVYYAWTSDKDVFDSIYPAGVPESALLKNEEGLWK